MPAPVALPLAVLNAADRLITFLMTVVHAVAPIALTGSTPTFSAHAAQILALRLVTLITTLIRISAFGIRAPSTPARTHLALPDQRARPNATLSLPRHSGWLLAALPDIASAIAADLRALLADPALTALLAAAPTLHRTLRPLLRGLDLAAPQTPPSPRNPPPHLPSPKPPPAAQPGRPLMAPPCRPKPGRGCHIEVAPSHPTTSCGQFVTLSQ